MSPIRLRVREIREAMGLTQEQLAARAGIRRATLSAAEGGSGVNLATLAKLAEALNVNASILIVHEPEAEE